MSSGVAFLVTPRTWYSVSPDVERARCLCWSITYIHPNTIHTHSLTPTHIHCCLCWRESHDRRQKWEWVWWQPVVPYSSIARGSVMSIWKTLFLIFCHLVTGFLMHQIKLRNESVMWFCILHSWLFQRSLAITLLLTDWLLIYDRFILRLR